MRHDSTSKADAAAPAAGIDVGKYRLHLAFANSGGVEEHANDAAGHRALIEALRRRGALQVGMDSTATYSAKVAEALREAGFIVNVFQPRQVKAFAQFRLKRAKSDKIDAPIIAQCTALSEPQATPDPRVADLCEHLTVVEQIGRRRPASSTPTTRRSAEETKRLTLRRREALRALVGMVRQHADLAERWR
jgi:transposase